MPRTTFSATTPDGEMDASLHTPEGDGPWPGVVVFPDAGGAREVIRDMADRIASAGYAAVVPDVYYRDKGYAPFDLATVFTDEKERNRLFGLMSSLTNEKVVSDTTALLDAMAARPEVAG